MLYRTKVFFLLFVLVALTCGMLLWLSLRKADSIAFGLVQGTVLALASSAAPGIDGDVHATLATVDQDESDAYQAIRDPLRRIRDANQSGQLKIAFIYTIRPTANGGWMYVIDAEEAGEDKSLIGDPVDFSGAEIPVLDQSRVDSTFATDEYGTWLTAFAPIRNAEGTAVALVGVDIAADQVIAQSKAIRQAGWTAFGGALLLAGISGHFLSRRVSAPLEQLNRQVEQIREGDFDAVSEVRSDDEFGRLGRALNQMGAALREREELKGALVRFVSSQAVDPAVGGTDGMRSRKVTVLAAGISGLNGLADHTSADQLYTLVNHWFSATVDTVLKHHGSIEKSESEVVIATYGMSLVDQSQERHAVETALELEAVFDRAKDTLPPVIQERIRIKMIVHTGTISLSGDSELGSLSNLITLASATRLRLAQSEADGFDHTIYVSGQSKRGLRGAIPLDDAPIELEAPTDIGDLHGVELSLSASTTDRVIRSL